MGQSSRWAARPWLTWPASLAACALLFALYAAGLRHNPPGSYLDEDAIAYNAYSISRTGHGEFGRAWPLYVQCYTGPYATYANSPYIYLLAGLYRLLPPSILLARLLSEALGFAAALLLGALARRLSGRRRVGATVALIALATPWLFEVSRLVFEVALYPLALVGFLWALHRAHRRDRWGPGDYLALAGGLALLTYAYTIGRLLAPLLALGMVLLAADVPRLKEVLAAWAAYGLTLIPLAAFQLHHPDLLGQRFYLISYVRQGAGVAGALPTFLSHYVANVSPQSLLVTGDPVGRHHVAGAGSVLLAPLLLALLGAARVAWRDRGDAWWHFVAYGLFVSVLPGALTVDVGHSLRMIGFPVFLLLLTVPALTWLWDGGTGQMPRLRLLTVLLALTVFQAGAFQLTFHRDGPHRDDLFDVPYRRVFLGALATGVSPIYLRDGYWGPAYIHAYWEATVAGLPLSRFVHLPQGATPPRGALVISSEDPRTIRGDVVAREGVYTAYRTP